MATSQEKPSKPPIPRWAWIFAVACFVIPVFTLGGAIPSAIGVFAGLAVIAIARQTEKTTDKKVLYCSVITGAAWTVFIVFLFSLAALQVKYPSLNPRAAKRTQSESKERTSAVTTERGAARDNEREELSEEKRRDIYEMAMRTRSHIEFAQQNGSSARHLQRLEEMHESRQEFTTRFYKITREELDAIVAEGQRNDWPTDR